MPTAFESSPRHAAGNGKQQAFHERTSNVNPVILDVFAVIGTSSFTYMLKEFSLHTAEI